MSTSVHSAYLLISNQVCNKCQELYAVLIVVSDSKKCTYSGISLLSPVPLGVPARLSPPRGPQKSELCHLALLGVGLEIA